MKFFLDSANLDEIKEARDLGLLDGITTNPTLVAKAGQSPDKLIPKMIELCDGPISYEVLASDFEGMMQEAQQVVEYGEQMVVKLPLTVDGLKATRACHDEGIETNVTLCFSPTQALLAAKAGASFVSPFVGRLDDISHDGMELIREIRAIFFNHDYETEILVASVRSPLHIRNAALEGADVVTVPFGVLKKTFAHPLTDRGLEAFLRDAEKFAT